MKTICHNFYRKIIFNASALWSGIIRMKAGKHNNVCYERHAICLLNIQTTAILTHTY